MGMSPSGRPTVARHGSDGRGRRRSGRLVVLGALVAIVGSGCLTLPAEYSGPTDAPRVVVQGDSLTFAAERGELAGDTTSTATLATDALVAAGHQAAVIGLHGATATNGAELVGIWDETGLAVPDVVVVAIGSNDVREVHEGTSSLRDAFADLDAYLDALDAQGVDCIAALTVATTSDAWGLNRFGPSWNERLRRHPAVDHVQRWDLTAAANPDALLDDGIHIAPDTGGDLYRAELVAAANACTDGR